VFTNFNVVLTPKASPLSFLIVLNGIDKPWFQPDSFIKNAVSIINFGVVPKHIKNNYSLISIRLKTLTVLSPKRINLRWLSIY
jgi:hypothetical protein